MLDLYLRNLRWRDLLEGDLMAQLGAVWTGGRRLEQLAADLGAERMLEHVERAIAYGRRRTATEIAAMPDGRYEAEGWMDADGAGRVNVTAKAAVEIDGDVVRVDFAGTDGQSASGFNGSRAVVEAAGRIPLLMAIDPDIPHNQGCLDAVTVAAERGSARAGVVPGLDRRRDDLARRRAAGRRLARASQAVPERVRAGTARWNNAPELYGAGGEDAEPWGLVLLNGGGGGGAARRHRRLAADHLAGGRGRAEGRLGRGDRAAAPARRSSSGRSSPTRWAPESGAAASGIRSTFRPTDGAIDSSTPPTGSTTRPTACSAGRPARRAAPTSQSPTARAPSTPRST